MKTPTVEETSKITPLIPNLGTVMHSVLGVHDFNGDTELTWGQFLLISLTDSWLNYGPDQYGFERVLTIASIVKDQVVEHVEDYVSEASDDLDFFRVGIADRRYLTCSDSSEFIDLETNDRLGQLDIFPVATFSIDVNAVLFRYRRKLVVLREDKDAVSVAVQEVTEARRGFEERGQLLDDSANSTPG